MAYPRRCPVCKATYGQAADGQHTTQNTAPGGTPSPQFPALSGRLLTLRCGHCKGTYAWDYFADAVVRPADEHPRRMPGARPHPYRTDVRRG